MDNTALARLERLTGFLEADPYNPSLLRDVAQAALASDQIQVALRCYCELDQVEPLNGEEANLAGITAMRSGEQEVAQGWFTRAMETDQSNTALRFNMAWSYALAKDYPPALEFLDEAVTGELPQAAMLDLQIAHELGQFTEAETKLDAYLEKHPDYEPLLAAASVLAMDVDRPDLARAAALKAGAHPDALTTLGTLDLAERKLDEAQAQFEQALASGRISPRAEIGVGLVALARGEPARAAEAIDTGARQFATHIGSWIASGWAHLLANDVEAARARFERAMQIDDRFGETHGSLAVISLLDGDIETAERGSTVALRLDPESFSGVLCKILIESSKGNSDQASDLFMRALEQPILPNGQTLMQALSAAVIAK